MASTGTSSRLQATRQLVWAAPIAIAGSTCFSLIIAALHFLRPDLDPVSSMTSEYVNGPYGLLMTCAFFSMCVATLSLVVGLYRGVPRQALSPAGLFFLGGWGVGVLVAMLFPIDPGGVALTLSGTIHQTAGPLTFLSATAGVAVLSWRFGRDARWRAFQPVLIALSLAILVGFVATAYSFFTGAGFGGLTQRIVLAALVTWILIVASNLRPAGASTRVA